MAIHEMSLPTIAEKAGAIVSELIERELGDVLGRHPTRLSITVLYPEHWIGEKPCNARDGLGTPCLVGVTIEDDGFEDEEGPGG